MAKAQKSRAKSAVRQAPKRRPTSEPPAPRPRPRPPATAAVAASREERKSTYPEAIATYERGIAALQRRAWAEAADRFREILSRFPEERELQERAQVYLRVCERELAVAAAEPRTNEERMVAATVALNAGDHRRTLQLLQDVLRQDPSSDLAEYMSAVVLAALGNREQAVVHLGRAIELNPENRNLARQDSDLEVLHEDEGFRRLMETPAASRRRKSRNGR